MTALGRPGDARERNLQGSGEIGIQVEDAAEGQRLSEEESVYTSTTAEGSL
jgi:hypothetical protein